MNGSELEGCYFATKSGGQINCYVAILIVMLALAVRFLPGMLKRMEERPPDPPPDAPLQNQDSMNSGWAPALNVLLSLLFIIGALSMVCGSGQGC